MAGRDWREGKGGKVFIHLYMSPEAAGEGNGNPLQYSCMENLRDRGAWWAAVYGVAQSWTRLKQLSSSSIQKLLSLSWGQVKFLSHLVAPLVQKTISTLTHLRLGTR